MSDGDGPDATGPVPGSLGWLDLTVDDAPRIRDFYHRVAGWRIQDVPMGDYQDYAMLDADGTAVAGVCHRRGGNADVPTGWLPYVVVEDLDASLAEVDALGGERLGDVKAMDGHGRYVPVRDPAGATIMLFEPATG